LLVAGCAAPASEGYVAAAPPPPTWQAPDAPAPYERGQASYYSDRLAGHRTAGGEPYDPGALTAAHRHLPIGTLVDVARPDGRHVTVRINDRGPHARGRIIDLSRRAAAALGMVREGVAEVVLRVLWVPPERRASM
jgi:rare lipoprotein A